MVKFLVVNKHFKGCVDNESRKKLNQSIKQTYFCNHIRCISFILFVSKDEEQQEKDTGLRLWDSTLQLKKCCATSTLSNLK